MGCQVSGSGFSSFPFARICYNKKQEKTGSVHHKHSEVFMKREFYEEIKAILATARNKVYQTANFAMVEAYWNIGSHKGIKSYRFSLSVLNCFFQEIVLYYFRHMAEMKAGCLYG